MIGVKILLRCAHCHVIFGASLATASMLCQQCSSMWHNGWVSHEQPLSCSRPVFSVFSLRVYEHQCRTLIVNAKANRSYGSGCFLADSAANHPKSRELAEWAEYIVATSPSLWSRWHGSVNIAQLFARRLSKPSQTPLRQPPYPLVWRLRKSSFRSKNQRTPYPEGTKSSYITRQFQRVTAKRILLVDDVITSGFTMAAVAHFYPNSEIKGLAIARAG